MTKRIAGTVVATLALVAGSFALAHQALALALTVNSTSDGVDANPGDGVCAASSGACTLRAAVMEGNKALVITNVTLPAGTYTLTIGGSGEDQSASGDLDLRWNVNIFGAGASTTILKAGVGLGDRLVDIPVAAGQTIAIKDVTLQGGSAPSGQDGGGLRDLGATSLVFWNDTVSGNSASGGSGGGLSFSGPSGTAVDLYNDTVSGNSAKTNGGGIDVEGAVSAAFHQDSMSNNSALNGGGMAGFIATGAAGSFTQLIGMTVSGNSTTAGGVGGGIDLSRAPPAFNLVVTGNSAGYGGGVYLWGGTLASTIDNSTIDDNTATVNGGGIYAVSCGTTCGTVRDTTIDGNTATLDGGGVWAKGELTLMGDLISHNRTLGTGAAGGAVYHTGNGGHPLVMTSDTVYANTGSPASGGVVLGSRSTDPLTNVTISGNSGGSSGNGIDVVAGTPAPQLENDIFDGNGTLCTGSIDDLGHNLDRANTCHLTKASDLVNTDPVFAGLADWGGPTYTLRLDWPSPAIDAGDNGVCPAADQRNVQLPQDGDSNGSVICDMGAYEAAQLTANSDVHLTNSPGSSTVKRGGTVTYTMGVTNTGNNGTTNSVLEDNLPSWLTFVSCSVSGGTGGTCGGSGSNRTVKITSVGVGSSWTVVIKATVSSSTPVGTVIADTASIFADNPDHSYSDNVATATVTVTS